MKKNILLIVILLQGFLLHAQTNFTGSASKNKVGLHEQFSLTFTLNNDGQRFVAPNLTDFTVLAGPSTSSSTSIINGRRTQENSYTYYLRAKKLGIYTIGSAYIVSEGKEYRSHSISIQVLKLAPKSTSNNSPEAKAKENVFLELDLSNTRPYVGEQIIAEYKLYFKQEVRSPELLEQPTYTGFWHEDFDLGDTYPIKEEMRSGKKFQVATLKKLILTPQRSGDLSIAGMDLEVPVYIPTNQRDVFGRRRSKMIQIICSTGNRTIKVKELPKQGKPSNFSGAVGDFKFTSKLDKDSILTNESVSLSMRIQGTGNLRMIDLPKFDIPNDIEAYEPKYKERIQLKNYGLSGYKRDEYLLIPRNKGTYKIAPQSFSFFNPQTEKYISIESPSYTLIVKGDGKDSTRSIIVGNVNKEDVAFIGKDILYIKTKIPRFQKARASFYGSTTFIVLVIIPIAIILIGLVLALLLRKSIIDIEQWKKGSASKQALKILESKKNAELDVYASIEQALEVYFLKKWKVDRANFNKEYLEELLLDKGVKKTVIKKLISLLESCEMARFTSQHSSTDRTSILQKTKSLIEQLENTKL